MTEFGATRVLLQQAQDALRQADAALKVADAELERRKVSAPVAVCRRADDQIGNLATHGSDYVTINALADYWGAHHRTIRKWIYRGRLQSRKVGRHVLVPRESALAFERQSPEWRRAEHMPPANGAHGAV